jgi:signal transduction histidine kinase
MFQRSAQIGERRWEIPYLSPDDAGWQAHRAGLDAHRPFRDFEFSRLGADGNERHISIHGDPVFDASGGFKGYRGVGADITERKREEQLLRLEHAVARCLAEANDQSSALKTVMRSICETNNWGRGTYWRADTAAGLMRFGEFWSSPGLEFDHYTEGSREVVFAPGVGVVGRVWQSGEPLWIADYLNDPRVVQQTLARESGMRSVFVFPVVAAGSTVGALAFFSRVAREPDERLLAATRMIGSEVGQFLQRLQAEEHVRQINAELESRVASRTQQLEVANHELEAFSYSVSHDLRAPLRAIQGFSRMVEQQYAGQIDEKGRDMLRRVSAGAEKMGLLIDDLLRLARISRQAMHFGRVDLSVLVREVLEELRGAEPERRVEWTIAPQVSVEGDPGLLRVMLQNLIGNAWKYSSRRELARIEFGVIDKEGHPVYFVRDNGAGFDMAYSDKLFGAFQRLHTTAEFPGSGIGLATVARILHRHGGTAWAEGRENEGATFYFSLG